MDNIEEDDNELKIVVFENLLALVYFCCLQWRLIKFLGDIFSMTWSCDFVSLPVVPFVAYVRFHSQ